MNLVNVVRKRSIFVVYPAALFDGWEVVKEHSDNPAIIFHTREKATSYAKAQAVMDGGVVKLENWFGDTESVWEAEQPQAHRPLALSTS